MIVADDIFQSLLLTLDGQVRFDYGEGTSETGERYELIQFTGLHDKNGKEIWQGDIIQQGKDVSVVKYDPPEFIAMAEISEDHCCNLLIGECEVIGNIYENSDLLNP